MTSEKEILKRPEIESATLPEDGAAEWLAYLQSGVATEEDFIAFKEWLARSKANLAAYRKVAQSWEDVGFVAMISELEAEQSVQTSLQKELAANPQPRFTRRWFVPAGIAASIAMAVGVGMWSMAPEPITTFEYATTMGEIRVVTLDDGSTVTLGASTAIQGRFSSKGRDIDLNRGRAFFDVTSDTERPFRVAAAKSQIQVVGTAFDVEYGPDAIQISVDHGRVKVIRTGSTAALDQSSVTSGERLRASLSGTILETTNYDIASLSWREGQLAYVDARLEDVIAEVNRYRSQKIKIADSAVEDLRVSFSVANDQTDVLLAGLEATLPIRVVHSGGSATIYSDNAQ